MLAPQLREKLFLDERTRFMVSSTLLTETDTFNGFGLNGTVRINSLLDTSIPDPIEWFYQESGLKECIDESARTYQEIAYRIPVEPKYYQQAKRFIPLPDLGFKAEDSISAFRSLQGACTSQDRATLEAS